MYPSALAIKYRVGDCATRSEFGDDDKLWEIKKIGTKHYGYTLYGGDGKMLSDEFDYFENNIAPFKRECKKKCDKVCERKPRK